MHIQINGFSMAYEDKGTGRPLLFIHGYPLNRTLWQAQFSLADVARVIAPDLRGHGQSEAIPGPYSMELLADDCNALLDALGVTQPVVVCGLSMGGYVAFAFYRKYAARVAALILTATRPGADSPEAKANRTQAIEAARDPLQGVNAIAKGMLPKLLSPVSLANRPELVARAGDILASASVEGVVGALTGMRERPDSTPLLAQIDLPTLIVHGADDQIISLQESEAMQVAIKNSRLHVIPEAGHLLNLEQPDLFNQVVREFILSL